MDETTIETEAAAMQAAQVGYAKRAGATAPAEAAPTVTPEQPPADAVPSPAPAANAPAVDDDEPSPQAEPGKSPETTIAAQLEDLKAQLHEMKANGMDSQTAHRLFGEIGGITRVVKQLQKKLAPTENELAGAITAAEKAAAEYPEFGAPMLQALKALAAQMPEAKTEPEPQPTAAAPQPTTASASTPASPYTSEQTVAIKFLNDLHPDRLQLNQAPEFQKWLAAKDAAFKDRFTKTWDFGFIAKGYTEFKDAQAAQKRKADRLAAAATPQGTAQTPTPTTLPDEAGFAIGYARQKRISLA